MKKLLKKIACLLLAFLFVCCSLFFSACDDEKTQFTDFAVCFIDVGEGDSIYIHFPDGKNFLIDTGSKSQANFNKIKKVLDSFSVSVIDYLLITHPDGDHVGNAIELLNNYQVGLTYTPYINKLTLFPQYSSFLDKVKEKSVQTKISEVFDNISGENYFLTFLSPKNYRQLDSSYYIFNNKIEPTKTDINNLSPIVYLDYMGVRFVFTGDCGEKQEQLVVNNNRLKVYNTHFQNKKVLLDSIDFLKVSHHGSDDASSVSFLELLTPKHAVISVGGDNYYGHPSSQTLLRLITVNENCEILRTDLNGNIIVSVDKTGKTTIAKEA